MLSCFAGTTHRRAVKRVGAVHGEHFIAGAANGTRLQILSYDGGCCRRLSCWWEHTHTNMPRCPCAATAGVLRYCCVCVRVRPASLEWQPGIRAGPLATTAHRQRNRATPGPHKMAPPRIAHALSGPAAPTQAFVRSTHRERTCVKPLSCSASAQRLQVLCSGRLPPRSI